jgi:hypothetical protein
MVMASSSSAPRRLALVLSGGPLAELRGKKEPRAPGGAP